MHRSSRIKSYRSRNALIIFTREPEAGKTKTRLMPYFEPEQCAELHRCMLRDISIEAEKTDADIVVVYTCGDSSDSSVEPVFLRSVMGKKATFLKQRGKDIGSRMYNAIDDVLALGYGKTVLIGTDIPEIEAETVDTAFTMLDVCDVVMGPTEDGGYYLIGMKDVHKEAFDVKYYGGSTVFEETVSSMRESGLAVEKVDVYSDIDTHDDVAGFRRRMRGDANLRRSHTGRFLTGTARISVIVPVYNEAAEIGRLLDQLKPYCDECEIIIVDGGSNDGTYDAICENNNRIIPLKTDKGRAIQMNAGAEASTGDILFFLHCDSDLPDRFTDEIRRVMASYDWGCFRVRFPSNNFFMITNRLISNCRAALRNLPFGDQGIFIDRALFFETGKFPEIPLMEDYEFSMRKRSCKLIKGPGITHGYITSSARRYGCCTRDVLRTEINMWKLRYMYRHGVSAEILRNLYDDIR